MCMKHTKKNKKSNIFSIITILILLIISSVLITRRMRKSKTEVRNEQEGSIKVAQDNDNYDDTNNVPKIRKEDLEEGDILLEDELDIDYDSFKKTSGENDIETPQNIDYKKLNEMDMLQGAFSVGEFQNGKSLTSAQYTNAAALLLQESNKDSARTFYTEEEVKNVVYSVFNVELNEYVSTSYMKHINKGFELSSDVEDMNKKIEIISRDVAAGTIYISFVSVNQKYMAKIATNTLTNEKYVQSIQKYS